MRDVFFMVVYPLGMLEWVVNRIFRLLEGQITFWHHRMQLRALIKGQTMPRGK